MSTTTALITELWTAEPHARGAWYDGDGDGACNAARRGMAMAEMCEGLPLYILAAAARECADVVAGVPGVAAHVAMWADAIPGARTARSAADYLARCAQVHGGWEIIRRHVPMDMVLAHWSR